jgi:hypothetical protein
LGYDSFQEIRETLSEDYQLCNTELIPPNRDVLQFLLERNPSGIFLIDDLVNFEEINPLERRQRESQIQNLIERLRIAEVTCYIVLLGTFIQFSEKLSAEVPVLKYSLPDAFAVQLMVNNFCSNQGLKLEREESLQRLTVACQGLPKGEIDLALNTYSALANNVEQLAEFILNYKVTQLRGLGLEFIAEPDVSSAGG